MTRDLSDVDFIDDEVKEIALQFNIPKSAASSLKRSIGSVEILQEHLGKHGPQNYIELIREREWTSKEIEEIEREWIAPIPRLYKDRMEGVQIKQNSEKYQDEDGHYSIITGLGGGWWAVTFSSESLENPRLRKELKGSEQVTELKEEIKRKRKRVRHDLRKYDNRWKGLARKLWRIEKELIAIYESHLQELDRLLETKKDRIIELKTAFPYLRDNDRLTARATNSSYSYVRQFKNVRGDIIRNQKLPKSQRKKALERDGQKCVRCGKEADIQVHHILPRTHGGTHELSNLATLCNDCHRHAHEGQSADDESKIVGMESREVVYESKEEFWEKWIETI